MFFRKLIFFVILMGNLLAKGQDTMDKKFIDFSGYQWEIKQGKSPMGPGNNYFSGSKRTVFIDEQGLHLRIDSLKQGWSAAEVISRETFGYGVYTFNVIAELDNLNPGLVFGMFLYNENLPPYHNEIDIEFTTWGGQTAENGFYTVHGDSLNKGDTRFYFDLNGSYTTHQIKWTPDSIIFSSYHGHQPAMNKLIYLWKWQHDNLPVPNFEKVHLNLWIFDKNKIHAPGKSTVIIKDFSFTPLSDIQNKKR